MESPASGADSSSDADSRPSTPSHGHAVHRCSGYAELSLEGRLIKWWEEVRASDRQPWLTPVPSPHAPYHQRRPSTTTGASSQQPSKCSGAAPATASSSQVPGLRTPPQTRPPKAPKQRKVTLVSPPGSRSCGPFMCHGLHNNYLIDEHSAGLKEAASAARVAAERKKASAPKPFLVGGRTAIGASNSGTASSGRRPAPWRPNRTKSVKEPFPFAFEASEEETRKSYREWQLNCSLRSAALQNRKLRQQISARSGGPSGAVGSGDTLKVGDCLRVVTKLSDASEEELPGEEDPGLVGALLILSSERQSFARADKTTTPPSKNIDKEYKQAKIASLGPKWSNLLGFKENKSIQAKIRTQRQRVASQASFPLPTTAPTFGRRDPERKVVRQKSRATLKLANRQITLKKTPSGGKQVAKKSVSKNQVEGNSGETEKKAPGGLCTQVKSCVEGTRTDEFNMFGTSPAAAHSRGVADAPGRGQHGGHSVRRRSESQLVSAAESEAAKWLANRTGPRRQAAGIPVVQLLLPNPLEMRTPPGDSRIAAVASNATGMGRRPKAPAAQPPLPAPISNAGGWPSNFVRPTGERNSKKWMAPPRRRTMPTIKGGTGSAFRRCFGESGAQLEMDDIEDALVFDWSELTVPSAGATRTTKGDKILALEAADHSDTSNEYLELAGPDHNTCMPSKLRMLGGMPKSLFGKGMDADAAYTRMSLAPKQKTSMETQVTPRECRPGRRVTTPTGHEVKRSVEVSASTGTSVESVFPPALRRDGANQAFKAVLDMVVQKADGRGGGGGDVNWASEEGHHMLFKNFLAHALNAGTIPPNSPVETHRDVSFNFSKGKSKYGSEWRKPHPKSAEESVKQSLLNTPRQNKSRDNAVSTLINNTGLDRLPSPGYGSRGRRSHMEMKAASRGIAVETEELAYPVQVSPRQVPAINRTKALTTANLGELVSTLRRAEKLS